MRILFTKAHGARNDFLLTWSNAVPPGDRRAMARAICDRHAGIGADGWIVVAPAHEERPAAIQLYNSDGSDSEISGNGTRCAAAFLLDAGLNATEIRINTGAGLKRLRVLEQRDACYQFEMDMGPATVDPGGLLTSLDLPDGPREVTILNVGNPQCVLFAGNLDFDWRSLGRAIEGHPRFPRRTNVSFVTVESRQSLQVRFWERGAGETESSGTGSTGAAAAAFLRGLIDSPVTVHTPAGPLLIRKQDESYLLTGPAEIIGGGEFLFRSER